jgi:uroporphyrinogen-III decarboxylase
MIDEFGKDNYIVNLGHGILQIFCRSRKRLLKRLKV